MDFSPVLEKIAANSSFIEGGCWLFRGGLNSTGYGAVYWEGKQYFVHRVSTVVFFGLDYENKQSQALHKLQCPNHNCWNPEHLYVGTQRDNNYDEYRKGGGWGRYNKIKTHCKNRHERKKENLTKSGNCKICHNEYMKKLRSGELKTRKQQERLTKGKG